VGGSASGSTWAPAYICYGNNNRSAMVRVPYGRLEFRLPDSGCNPYLVHAALIAAGMDGIERELEPGDPLNINLYALSPAEREAQGIEILPQNLGEAIAALEADSVLTNAIGKEVMGEFIRIKKDEWIDYCRHVSDWEIKRYAEFF
jgi:glutamine synthetase